VAHPCARTSCQSCAAMAGHQQCAVKLVVPVNPPQLGFRVTQEGIDYLSGFSRPLHVVSTIGKMRYGKSYVQCLLSEDLNVFQLGHTTASCTLGIDVYVRPHPSGRGHLVLLDVEGQGSTDRNATYDTALTTIAMLLSSLVVYNCMTVGAQEQVDNLRLLSGFMQKVIDKTVETTADEADGDRADRDFPFCMWLLRDFHLQLVDGNGNPCDADTYLETVLLAPVPGGRTRAALEKNRMLQDIKTIFGTQKRCLRTLPRPVATEEDFKLLDKQGYGSSVVRQEFKDQSAVVIRDILAKADVKRFEGAELSGSSLAALLQTLCSTLDADGVPEVTTAWQQVCQVQLEKGLAAARTAFLETMAAALKGKRPAVAALSRTGLRPPDTGIPVQEDDLQSCIGSADAASRKAFFALACAPGDEEAKQLSAALDDSHKREYDGNKQLAVAFCEALLGILYAPVRQGIREGRYTCEGGFKSYSQHLEVAMLDYRDCCSSCVPEQTAAQCAEAFAHSLEEERHLVMENDRALTAAQRKAAVDAEQLQYERLSRKREQEEQQAALKRQRAEHTAQMETMQNAAKVMQEQMEQQREEDKRLNEQRHAQMEEFMRQNQKEGQDLMKQVIANSSKQTEEQSKQMERIMQTMADSNAAQQESLAGLTQSIADLANKPPVVVESGGGCILQ